MRRLAVLAVLVIVAVALFTTAAAAKPRRYWCARAVALQKQIAEAAAQRDALANRQDALSEQLEALGLTPTGEPTIVFPIYRLTPEDQYADAQARCSKVR